MNNRKKKTEKVNVVVENKYKYLFNFFKSKSLWVSLLVSLGIMILGMIFFVSGYFTKNEIVVRLSPISMYVISALTFMCAVLIPNRSKRDYAKQNHYDTNYPVSVLNEVIRVRSPLVLIGLISLLGGTIFDLIYLIL